ncbi:hypothetical protein [Neobacillus rhizophilus]|uniref:hypothetical protein n=1 Tax=Neobacillus rhizophilus TaxID=2833579 RepID=UPI00355923C9
MQVAQGQKATEPATPVMDKYAFEAWYTDYDRTYGHGFLFNYFTWNVAICEVFENLTLKESEASCPS